MHAVHTPLAATRISGRVSALRNKRTQITELPMSVLMTEDRRSPTRTARLSTHHSITPPRKPSRRKDLEDNLLHKPCYIVYFVSNSVAMARGSVVVTW